MNSNDGPEIFTNHYFRHGLRFDPKHGCRIVFLPDVDQIWVHLNIVPEYRAPYLRRLMESLLYLRDYNPNERDQYLFRTSSSKKKKGQSNEPVLVSINYNHGSVRVHEGPPSSSRAYKDQIKNGHLAPYPVSYPEPYGREIRRLLKAHKIVPGQDRNIEQDLWRLYELWLMFVSNEEDEEQEFDDDDDEIEEKPCFLSNQRCDKGDPSRQFTTTALLPNLDCGQRRGQALGKQPDNNNIKGKEGPRPFPSRPQIQLLLEDDVHYLRSVESVPRFDCYGKLPDGCEPPPMPIVNLRSRSRDGSNSTESINMRSASAAVATVAGGSGVTYSGLISDPTSSRRKQRRHHRNCYTDDSHGDSHSHSHSRRRHRHRRNKCRPLTAIFGRQFQIDLHSREENTKASSSDQEAPMNRSSAPTGVATVHATDSLHNLTISTTGTTKTTVDSSNNNLHVSPLSPMSLEAARALWFLRAQVQAHTNSKQKQRQQQDRAQYEHGLLSPAFKAFGVDLVGNSSTINSPPCFFPSPPSRSSSSRLLSSFSSRASSSSSSRRSRRTVEAALSTHQTGREKGDTDDCSSEDMELDMKRMSL